MNNKEFEKRLSEKLPLKTEVIAQMSEEFISLIEQSLTQNKAVQIAQFGTFELKKRGERITKHPSTKNRILIPPKLVLNFTPAKSIKENFKNNQSDES
ncbi:MAG: HU family DNA-binding protein [Bacteroidales bacterium]